MEQLPQLHDNEPQLTYEDADMILDMFMDAMWEEYPELSINLGHVDRQSGNRISVGVDYEADVAKVQELWQQYAPTGVPVTVHVMGSNV